MAVRPIDEKIVAMKMDITDFVKKAADTTSIFGKLQSAMAKIPGVDMSKVTQSIGNIQSAIQKVDMSSLGNNLDQVAGRFGSLEVMAITALTNITNKAVNAGLQLSKSLTVDPLMDGWREYENKMGSIGTMLSNTEWAGSTLDDVKKTLGELNDYADNTIYSFEQMTANVGRFTAAGVTLEDSAIAIKGLGNLAAVSGSNVDQLNTVMYQMSQALAAGKLNLMDWNSLVNGGMAGKKTQDALVATARAMGQNVDLTDGFRNSIQQGWLTSEVFLETLKKFGTDESMTKAATSVRTFTGMLGALKEGVGSGWAQTWEIVFGDFEVATKRWTALSEVIGGFFKRSSDARNKFIQGLADIGVFQLVFDAITNIGKAVLAVTDAIGKGIGKAFSGMDSGFTGVLAAIVKGFSKLTEMLIPSEGMLKAITFLFQALAFPIRVVIEVLSFLGKVLFKVLSIPFALIKALISGISTLAGYFGDLGNKLIDNIKSGKALSSAMEWLTKTYSKISDVTRTVVKYIQAFSSAVGDAWDIITKRDFSDVGPWASKNADKLLAIRKAVLEFVSGVKEAWNILINGDFTGKGPWAEDSKIVDKLFKIREAVLGFVHGVISAWDILVNGNYVSGTPWDLDSDLVVRLFKIRSQIQEFVSGVVEAWSLLTKGDFTGKGPWEEDSKIVNFFLNVREGVIDLVDDLKKFGPAIAQAWSILADGVNIKGPWDKDSIIVGFLQSVRQAAIDFADAMSEVWKGIKEIDFANPFKDVSAATGVIDILKMAALGLAGIFVVLGGAVKEAWTIMSTGLVSGKGPWKEDSVIVGFLRRVGEGFKEFGENIKSFRISMDPVKNAFNKLIGALKTGYDWVKTKLSGLGEAIKNALPSGNQLFAGGFIAGLIAIFGVVAKVAWDLYEVFTGWGKIGQGVADTLDSVSGALNAFTAQVYVNALVTLSIGIALLAGSLWLISRLDGDEIGRGVYAMTASLAAMVGAMFALSKFDLTMGPMKIAATMVGLAIGVSIMAGALKKLAEMDMGEITRGIYGLIGIMGTLSGALVIMSKFGGGKVGASAIQMVAIGAAIHILISAVKKLANIDGDELQKGLTALGYMLLELSLFMAIAGRSKFGIGSTLGMLAVGQAIMNITDAVKEINKIDPEQMKQGLVTIAKILTAIALFALVTSDRGLFSAGVGMLLIAGALTAMLVPITILGNMDIEKLVKGLGAMAAALLAIAAAVRLAGSGNMMVAGAGMLLIAAALTALLIPITAFATMGWGPLLTGMAGLALALAIIGGATYLLTPVIPLLTAFGLGILALGAGMMLASGALALFGFGLMTLATLSSGAIATIVATIGTLLIGLASLIPTAVDFIVKLIMQIAEAIAVNAPKLVDAMARAIVGMLEVIAKHIPAFVDAAVKIITNFLDALAKNLPKIVQSAANLIVAFIESLADAVDKNGPKFLNAIMKLMGEVLLLMIEAGVVVVNALFGWIPGVTEATKSIGDTAQKTIEDAFDAYGVGKDKGDDFNKALKDKKGGAKDAGAEVGKNAKDGAGTADLKKVGQDKGADFTKALQDKANEAKNAGKSMADKGKEGAASVNMKTTGDNFGSGFASGISGTWNAVYSSAKSLAISAKNAVEKWLDIHSPSRVMREDGGFFGEGFALGIADKAKRVGTAAKALAVNAKDSLNRFIDGFELPADDNELHFKAVIDYDSFDVNRFGRLTPVTVKPDTSLTTSLASSARAQMGQNGNTSTGNVDSSTHTTTNQYDIKVEAKGVSSRGEIRKLAEQIQTELKNLNDRTRISKGEGVAF